jgi:hypothetical protein
MTQEPRTIIVLLGMHRSGTSLTMSVLNALGVNCGDRLIPGGRGNENGFWEHGAIVAAHERLLVDLDRVWHGPKGSFALPAGWLESDAAQRAKKELAAIVEQEVDRSDGSIWGFKDPRTCRLLPLWREIFDRTGTKPQYFLAVRNPTAVCASLLKKNGMSQSRGELVWLQHNLEALEQVGANKLLVSDYDRLIERTESEVVRLATALSPLLQIGPSEKSQAVARIAPELRRSAVRDAFVQNSWVEMAYQALAAMARDEPPNDAFNQLRGGFGDMQKLFEPWQKDRRHPLLDWATRLIVRRGYS